MVARDGIEPPTPAFSGPRSTTELPGLSADFGVAFPAWGPARPEKEGRVHEQFAATTGLVYQLPGHKPNRGRWNGRARRMRAREADGIALSAAAVVLYTGEQLCAVHACCWFPLRFLSPLP